MAISNGIASIRTTVYCIFNQMQFQLLIILSNLLKNFAFTWKDIQIDWHFKLWQLWVMIYTETVITWEMKKRYFLITARWLYILVPRYIINNFCRCLSLSPLLEECRDQKLRESLWDLSSQFHWSPQRKLHHLCQDQVSFSSSGSGPGSPRQPLPGTWGRGDSVFAAKKDKNGPWR